MSGLPSLTTRAVQRTIDFCISGWLNVLPLTYHHFHLLAQQFCDTFLVANEVRGALGDLAVLRYREIVHEPIV